MSNQARLRLRFLTVERRPARERAIRVEVRAVRNRQLLRQRRVQIPPSLSVQVPAIPHPHQHMYARVVSTRFRDVNLAPFALADDETKVVYLFRQPSQWDARFSRWSTLPASFAAFKRVLNASADIRVIGDGVVKTFARSTYDGIDPAKYKLILAKAALLNLRSKLTELRDPLGQGRRWFSYVRRIIKMGRERFVAVVDADMARHVLRIKQEIDRFEDYEQANARNHHRNFPKAYRVSKKRDELFSIKSSEDLANVQLTLGRGTDPLTDENVWLLDTDIDEHGDWARHVGDLIRHKFTGGTHPYDIHEFLLFLRKTRSLGYRLWPKA